MPFELLRHVFQRADIGGDVLALGAVAAGGGGDEFAVLVAQRHGEPVDLRLGAEGDFLVVAQFEEAADAGDEIDDVLLRERVVERQHRQRVADFLELAGRRAPDPARRRIRPHEVGEALLDRRVALAQRVVGGVADGRLVLLVIALVVRGDLGRQPGQLGLGLRFGQVGGFDFGRLSF